MIEKHSDLQVDCSKMMIMDNVENIMMSEELFNKYKLIIDESKIEQLIAKIPEEKRYTLTFEEKIEYIKKILAYDVSTPIKNLFDDVLCFISKLE